ncbi:hypothetical protein [Bosea vestrisii]|uniref:ParB-like nuclease family protein n=1 Tax=Bosea vestrisii TaxID=151416 RepID=A0ABW0H4D7_9HYPH
MNALLLPRRRSTALFEDRKNGVIEPIVFLGGAVLDGRNRYMAARELGIEYPRCDYIGDDPLGFVISRNLARRHLSESQRAAVAAEIANLGHGGDRSDQGANLPLAPDLAAPPPVSVAKAAESLSR